MGKPRMIIVIRHAQSHGNQNRAIHQTTPDHRVKLTPEGWTQAHEAGRQLRALLRKEDTLRIFTSPYRRTRETTEGILRSLTSNDPEPSPFQRDAISVMEEPRIREQDFGNFQPNSDAMEKMWRERADYGHFFYRIPNGESAADAYDRVSGFNESLWRSFSEPDFPSVCVLVTHGLMTRVFLMKWYHWSVEYFEDLRNINHCEFVIMERNQEDRKYILQNKLRTWSELKRKAAAESGRRPSTVPSRDGECPDNCNHVHDVQARNPKRRNTGYLDVSSAGFSFQPRPATPQSQRPPPVIEEAAESSTTETSTAGLKSAGTDTKDMHQPYKPPSNNTQHQPHPDPLALEEDSEAFPQPTTLPSTTLATTFTTTDLTETDSPNLDSTNLANLPMDAASFSKRLAAAHRPRQLPDYMEGGRDFGGTYSGAASPVNEGSPSHSRGASGEYFGSGLKKAISVDVGKVKWNETGDWGSGSEGGAMADALGDQSPQDSREESAADVVEAAAEEDDLGGAENVGFAKAGEAVTGREGMGKEEAGREVLGRRR